MVLLGGVSIFGGSGTMVGVALSILIVLNIRNGLGLANIDQNTQTGVIGVLLILSVLVPNLVARPLWRARVHERLLGEGGDTPRHEPDLHPTQTLTQEERLDEVDDSGSTRGACMARGLMLRRRRGLRGRRGGRRRPTAAAPPRASADGKLAPGKEFKSVFIPKQTGIAVFDQANDGAKEAAGELQVDRGRVPRPVVAGQLRVRADRHRDQRRRRRASTGS